MVEGRTEGSSNTEGRGNNANAGSDLDRRGSVKANDGEATVEAGFNPGPAAVADATAVAFSDESLDLMRAETAAKKPAQKFPPQMPTDNGTGVPMPRPRPDMTSAASLLPAHIQFDRDKRTVIVLDDYRDHNTWTLGNKGFSHGELIARINEENGFNAVRMQAGTLKSGMLELPKSLKAVNDAIDSGKISIKPGDVVNLSLSHSITYAELNRMSGLQITPQNVASQRDQVLAAFRAKVADPSTPQKDRNYMSNVLEVTAQIRQMQARGLEVVASAGNDGPNYFNIAFIAADKMFAAVGADGQPAPYSQTNSLTTDGKGQVDFYSMPVLLLDTTPIAQQQGVYRLDGSKVTLSGKEFGGMLQTQPITRDLLKQLLTSTAGGISPEFAAMNPDSWRVGNLALSAQGTSFVNLFELPKEKKPR